MTSDQDRKLAANAEFERQYARLNAAQREAVDTIDGPVMVIAGPGTGKTTILTLRIANILKQTDTPPSGILAITFTESGVKAMRKKLRIIIGSRADEVRIHTFHGFAASVIAEFQDHFPHLSRTKQISDIEQEALVRDILKAKQFSGTGLRPAGEPDFYVGSILKAISDSKKEAWTPEMVRSFAREEIERMKNDDDSISTRGATKGKLKAEALKRIEKCERTVAFADAYDAYEARKLAERKMDFDDLIIELLAAFRAGAKEAEPENLLLRMLQEKFLYLLVDEHQDTNDSQNLLIHSLADFFDEPNLFVVGDEKQAIYRFQGASVGNFLAFQNVWKSMKVISLTDNYRSHQSLLDASFSLIEQNYAEGEHEKLRIRLRAGGQEEARPIEIVSAGNTAAAEEQLVRELREIVGGTEKAGAAAGPGSSGQSGKTAAIIVRRNRDVERILSLLESEDIPASAERGADIFSHPVGSLFFDLIKFLCDQSQIEALARTVAGGMWGLEFGPAAALICDIRSGKLFAINRDLPNVSKLLLEKSRSGALAYLILAAELSGFLPLAARNPLSAEVWHSIVSLATDLSARGSLEDPVALMQELLSYRSSAKQRSIKISTGVSDAQVTVMTAHSSKGLEFDYVFIPYATEDTWMPRAKSSYFVLPREKEEGDETRDARRLFYVALTRARKHATILYGLEEGLGKELLPLRFIAELDRNHISQIDIPASDTASLLERKTKSVAVLDERRRAELAEYAKHSLLERGLSVTALNHFCECPSSFFFKSILKLPEAPSASSEKGNAMHEALSLIWHADEETKRDPKKIAAEIELVVKSYFEKSLLPLFEKEPVVAELVEAAPAVALALVPHFAIGAGQKVATETWVETVFPGEYKAANDAAGETKAVPLGLHGKLDAVIEVSGDAGEKTLVFDYKTREAMSVAALKGETKSSDGGYFRQLIFYRMLIEGASGKHVEPALVFIKPDDKGRCPTLSVPIEQADIDRVRGEIQELIDRAWSGTLLDGVCEEKDCQWCRLKKEMGWGR